MDASNCGKASNQVDTIQSWQNKVMRIILVAVQPFTSPTGLCRYAANLFTALKENPSNEVHLICAPWQRSYFVQILNIPPSAISTINIRNTLFGRYIAVPWALRRRAIELRPDVVHFISPSLSSFLVESPTVTTVHDLYSYTNPNALSFLNRFLNRMVAWISIKSTDKIITISGETQKSLGLYFPGSSQKTSMIYQPININVSMATNEQSISQPYLLTIAGHRRHKNIDIVMKALGVLNQERAPDSGLKLVLVGSEGPETLSLRSLARDLGIETIFLSSVSDAVLCRLYLDTECVVIASEVEGFCLPLAESITLGVRVVCSDIPILREVAAHRATYFELSDLAASNLAAAILASTSAPRPLGEPEAFGSAEYRTRVTGVYEQAIHAQ